MYNPIYQSRNPQRLKFSGKAESRYTKVVVRAAVLDVLRGQIRSELKCGLQIH